MTIPARCPHGHGGTASREVSLYISDGRWATSVNQVEDDSGNVPEDDYSALQALGTPDTFEYGDSSTAWTAAEQNDGLRTLTFEFGATVTATGVLVREAGGNGFIDEVVFIDSSDTEHTATLSYGVTGEIVIVFLTKLTLHRFGP